MWGRINTGPAIIYWGRMLRPMRQNTTYFSPLAAQEYGISHRRGGWKYGGDGSSIHVFVREIPILPKSVMG